MHKKIAFIGSVGTGKSTMINVLSDTETVKTDVESSVDIGKELTTVGIDYGSINLGDNQKLGLYGVPGQKRFSFIWDFAKQGLWASVLLIKNEDENSLNEMLDLIDYFEINNQSLCVVGITHSEQSTSDHFFRKIKKVIKNKELTLPVYRVDGRNRDHTLMIMNTLIAQGENK